ncbi:MAG: hypothetical protein JKX98_03695, partial [Alcanivoracaceae bacterium]|nr:hypothetical protein [Alcanivoracaceae bacterium]
MQTIKIFLASSNELIDDREQFEKEIYRKSKLWSEGDIDFKLEIWEDLSSQMSKTRLQDDYNKKIEESDLFVLLAYSKVGTFTEEEFDTAYASFNLHNKPTISTYFKDISTKTETSLAKFKIKLAGLGHFYTAYSDFNHLWIKFNKELDALLLPDIFKNKTSHETSNKTRQDYGDKSLNKQLGNIPSNPSLLIGREGQLEQIQQKLFGGNNL